MNPLNQRSLLFAMVCATVLAPVRSVADEPVAPAAYPMDRYKLLFDRFPFGREAQSQPSPTPPKGPGIADQWQLTGHFKLGDVTYANVLNRQSQQRETLSSDETNPQRLKVVSLKDDSDPYNVKVIVSMGSETGTLSFDRPAPPKMPVTPPGQMPGSQPPVQMPNPAAGQTPGTPHGNNPPASQRNGNPGK